MTTLKADDRSRVKLPEVQPGEVFAYEKSPDGRIVLTKLEPAKVKTNRAHLVKEGGYYVGVTQRPIDMAALERALEEFP